jgi:hypothetical protein
VIVLRLNFLSLQVDRKAETIPFNVVFINALYMGVNERVMGLLRADNLSKKPVLF